MKIKLSMLAAVLLLGFVASAGAGEKTFEKYNFAVTTMQNDTWKLPSPKTMTSVVIARVWDPKTSRKFSVIIYNNNHPDRPFDRVMIDEFLSFYVNKQGRKVLRSGDFQVGGIAGYELSGSGKTPAGKTFQEYMRTTSVGPHIYCIQAISFEGDPTKDKDLMAMVDSFRFLTPPVLPEPKFWDSPAGWGVILIIGFLTIGLLVGIKWAIEKRQATKE
jgi:hypothetical protein